MSYDLAVFDPEAAPREKAAFLAWFEQQTDWQDERTYDDPALCAPGLRAWMLDMISEGFLAMNGPHAAPDDADMSRVTGYSINTSLIYADFRWSQVEAAYEAVFRLAQKHRLGFFDVSADDGQVWWPNENGVLTCTFAVGTGDADMLPRE